MHGGATGSGGPPGARNGNYRHGRYTREAIEELRKLRAWIKPPPDKKQQQEITRATSRVGERAARVTARLEKGEGYALHISPPHTDVQGWGNHLKDAFGTASTEFAAAEMERLVNALGSAPTECALDAALASIGAAQPKDEIEAMLAVQMAVTHAHVMDFMGRAKRAKEIPQFEFHRQHGREALANVHRPGRNPCQAATWWPADRTGGACSRVSRRPSRCGKRNPSAEYGGWGEKENVGATPCPWLFTWHADAKPGQGEAHCASSLQRQKGAAECTVVQRVVAGLLALATATIGMDVTPAKRSKSYGS